MTGLAQYRKAIVAAGTVLVGFLVQLVGPDSPWVVLATAVLTALATWRVRNADPPAAVDATPPPPVMKATGNVVLREPPAQGLGGLPPMR